MLATLIVFTLCERDALSFAPTVSGVPAWGDRSSCVRIGARNLGVAYRFVSPGSRELHGAHVRIQLPPTYQLAGSERYVVTLRPDENGGPGQDILASSEITILPGDRPWVDVPLAGAQLVAGGAYHLLIRPTDRKSHARACFLMHRGRRPTESQPWSALRPTPSGWKVIGTKRLWAEPVFLLEFVDGELWGQPYGTVRADRLYAGHALSSEFLATGDAVLSSISARIQSRGNSRSVNYTLTDQAGTLIDSGVLAPKDDDPRWSHGYHAVLDNPAVLIEGASYRLILDAPEASLPNAALLHMTPITDFVGDTPASSAKIAGRLLAAVDDPARKQVSKGVLSVDFDATPATCGNGQVDRGEQCDGASDAACPGLCRQDCQCPTAAPSVCGDGVRSGPAEVCDGGDDALCPGHCLSDCSCGIDATSRNVASMVSVRASSENTQPRQRATAAVDGVIGGLPGTAKYEWASRGEGAGAWLQLAWATPVVVDRVVLHDRPSLTDNLLAATLRFNDGTEIAVGPLPPDGRGQEIVFPARAVLSLTLIVASIAGTNAGLSEIEVFAAAPLPTLTATPGVRPTATSIPSSPTATLTRGVAATASDAPTPASSPQGTASASASPSPVAVPSPPPSSCTGATLFVSPDGNDANSGGSEQSALRTLQHAVNVARAGDVICATAGIYRERVAITNKSGTQASPIVITGVPGAVVDGGSVAADDGSAVNAGWVQVAAGDPVIPGGDSRVWKNTFKIAGVSPEMMTWDQGLGAGAQYVLRIGIAYDYVTQKMDDGSGADILQNGPCHADTWGGTCVHDWTPIHAMFGVKPSTGAVYVRFEDGSTPNGKALTFAPRRVGAIHITNSDWIVVKSLTIRNADMGVFIDGGSDDVTVQGNTVTGSGWGILVLPWGNLTRPNRALIKQNTVTLNSLSDLSPGNPRHWFIWGTFRGDSKTQFDGVRIGISVYDAGDDIVVDSNIIHASFDGISAATDIPWAASTSATIFRNLIVRNNTIEHCANDALDLFQSQNQQIYWNRIQDVNMGMRLGIQPGPGPVFIYENTVWNASYPSAQTENGGVYLYSPTRAIIGIYHNSFSVRSPFTYGSTASIAGSGVCPTDPGYCAQNVHLYNNIFSVLEANGANTSGWRTSASRPTLDYNWFNVNPDYGLATNGGHNVIRSGSMWPREVDPSPFIPTVSALALGLDLSGNNPACGTACRGMSPGYFNGAAPDAGAVQQ